MSFLFLRTIYNFKLGFQFDCSFYDGARSKASEFALLASFVVTKFRQRNMKHTILHCLAGILRMLN